MTMTAKRVTTRTAHDVIAARKDFKTSGSLRGESKSVGYTPWTGYLPAEWHESVRQASYVVYSYSTPIGWWSEADGWTVPSEKYSITTTKHQSNLPWGEHVRRTLTDKA